MRRYFSRHSMSMCFVCFALYLPVFAARPFVTDDAGTVESGKFELEAACDYQDPDISTGINLKHGITDRMDFNIGLGCLPSAIRRHDEQVFFPADIAVKYAFVPNLLAMSFGTCLGEETYNINAVITKFFGSIECDANLGYQIQSSMKNADMTYGIATVYEFTRLGVGAEIYGSNDDLTWWQVGARFAVSEGLKFDAGIGGSFEKTPSYTVTIGLWWTFPLNSNVK
jgi:hypothetical protein